MITNADIEKLKDTFATKDDLRNELKKYPTKDYIKREFKKYATKVDLKEAIADVKVELGEVHEEIGAMAMVIGRMENKLDGIVGGMHDLWTENGAGSAHLVRHDRQIATLARATGVALPD